MVGVSHACDYPEIARVKPVVSRSVQQITHLTSEEIDAIVRQARANSNPLYWIDGDLLQELEPKCVVRATSADRSERRTLAQNDIEAPTCHVV